MEKKSGGLPRLEYRSESPLGRTEGPNPWPRGLNKPADPQGGWARILAQGLPNRAPTLPISGVCRCLSPFGFPFFLSFWVPFGPCRKPWQTRVEGTQNPDV